MNNLLPPYFNSMKLKLHELCNVYSIRKPTFHLPVIRHEFARQLIGYKLLELLNTESGTLLVLSKVHTHSFIGFKIYIFYVDIRHWPMQIYYMKVINKTTIYKAVRKQRHKMHTFKREEKRKSLVAIIFLKSNNTAISKRKGFSL